MLLPTIDYHKSHLLKPTMYKSLRAIFFEVWQSASVAAGPWFRAVQPASRSGLCDNSLNFSVDNSLGRIWVRPTPLPVSNHRGSTPQPLQVFESFFLGDKDFIEGASPSIADMRFAGSLEFLNIIDCELPVWVEDYLTAMEDGSCLAFFRGIADSIYFRDPNGYVIELPAKNENHDDAMVPKTNGTRQILDDWKTAKAP